jgi:hypothetical protein
LCKTITALGNIFEIITHDSTVATTNLPKADDGTSSASLFHHQHRCSIIDDEQQLDVSLLAAAILD